MNEGNPTPREGGAPSPARPAPGGADGPAAALAESEAAGAVSVGGRRGPHLPHLPHLPHSGRSTHPLMVARRRAIRRAAGAAGALGVLAGALVALSAMSWDRHLPAASRAIEERAGLRLAGDPTVRLRLLPMPHLVVEDVVLEMATPEAAALLAADEAFAAAREAAGGPGGGPRPFLRAERVYLSANPAALALGSPFVNVHIENPEVSVRLFEGEGYDAEPVLRLLTRMGDPERGLPSLRSITIIDGRLFYEQIGDRGRSLHTLVVEDGRARIDARDGRIRAEARSARYDRAGYRYEVVLRPFEAANWSASGRFARYDGERESGAASFRGSVLLRPGPVAHVTLTSEGG